MRQYFMQGLSVWFQLTSPIAGSSHSLADRELIRKARLLSIALFFTVVIIVIISFEDILYSPNLLMYEIPLVSATLLAISFNRKKRLVTATACHIGGNLFAFSLQLWSIDSSHSVSFLWQWSALMSQSVLAGMFLSWQGPLVVGCVSCLLIDTIYFIHQKSGSFLHFLSFADQINFITIFNVNLLVIALVGSFYSLSVKQAVQQADRAQEIEWAHTQLEQVHGDLEQAHQDLRAAFAQVEELATHDALTGLMNHRTFQSHLTSLLNQEQSGSGPVALIFADLDHFKHINDTWGHAVGDIALKHLAQIFQSYIHQEELFARYGGEEFVIVLPNCNLEEAVARAEQLRMGLATTPVLIDIQHSISLTVSIGIAMYPYHATTNTTLLTAADKAMYQAKHSGRNRVCYPNLQPAYAA